MLSFLKGLFPPKTDFKGLLANGAVIIDVRTPQEFDSGHIKGSHNYPLDILDARKDEIKKKNKPVIAVCRSGTRSAMAVKRLKQAGIDAYNGGGWTSLMQDVT